MRLLGHPLYYRPLLVGLSLMLFQQVGGEILLDREIVMYAYSTSRLAL